jgi:serine/threonine protein kinase
MGNADVIGSQERAGGTDGAARAVEPTPMAERTLGDLRTVQPAVGLAAAGADISIGDLRTIGGAAADRAAPAFEADGQLIADRYEIRRRLGHGGMGVVYLAVDSKLCREVAVKRLLGGHDAASRRGLDLFLKEARAIAALNHRNIVTIHELGEDDRGPFIVTEYLAGGDLRRKIHESVRLSPAQALEVTRAVGQALAYAHGKGVIHRDVKPGNVLLDAEGTPKLVDFGLAQMGQESDLVVTGQGMGTLAYMAPEQRRDAKHVDARTDVYALAKTLYHMVTGDVPDTVDLEMVPPDMRPALRQALKYKSEERPASVLEFLESLTGAGAGAPQAAAATADASAPPRPGTCAGCGHANPEAARFCERCGAGMFEKCPKCAAEKRSGVSHCSACGVRSGPYRIAQEALAQAQEAVKGRRYAEAVAHADRGLQTEYFKDKLQAVRTEADRHEQRIAALAAAAAELAGRGSFPEALRKYDEALKIDPSREALKRAREELAARRRTQTVNEHLAAARKGLEDKRFDTVITACMSLQQLGQVGPEVKGLWDRAKVIQKDHADRIQLVNRLRKTLRYPEALEEMKALAADYPWDERVAKAQADFAHSLRRVETLVGLAREDLTHKRFEAVAQSCAAIRQARPDHPEAAKLAEQAEALRADHAGRLAEAAGLRDAFDPAAAAGVLRALAADYPWEPQAAAELAACDATLARLAELPALARAAAGSPSAARARWVELLGLNPTDGAARAAVVAIDRRAARRRLGKRVAAATSAAAAVAAGSALWMAANDRGHLSDARARLADHDFPAARAELARAGWFAGSARTDVAREVDEADLAATVDRAVADARLGKFDAAGRGFQAADTLAAGAGLTVPVPPREEFARAAFAAAVAAAEAGRVDDVGRRFELAAAFAARHQVGDPAAARKRLVTALDAKAAALSQSGDYEVARAALKLSGTVGGDPAGVKARLDELAGLERTSAPALAARRAAEAAADAAAQKGAARLAPADWDAAGKAMEAARQSFERRAFAEAGPAFDAAKSRYAAALQRAEKAAAAQGARQEFEGAVQAAGPDKLGRFGGTAWRDVAAAAAAAVAAQEGVAGDPDKAAADFRRALGLLPAAVAAAEAGAAAAQRAELLARAKANDSRENGKVALAALDELLTLDPANAEAAALRVKVLGYFDDAFRIVVWNTHNWKYADRGTESFDVALFDGDRQVWGRRGIALEWKREPSSVAIPVPLLRFDRVRLTITECHGVSAGLAELEVFRGADNLARGGAVTTDSRYPSHIANPRNLVDGKTDDVGDGAGFWLHDHKSGWIEVKLRLASDDLGLDPVVQAPAPDAAAAPADAAAPAEPPAPAAVLDLPGLGRQRFAEVQVNAAWVPLAADAKVYGPVNSKNVGAVFGPIPAALAGRSFTRLPMHNTMEEARIAFAVTRPGVVLMSVQGWGGSGSGGPWQQECVDRDGLARAGWREVPNPGGRTLFYRACAAGERFSYRTDKYHPPILIK